MHSNQIRIIGMDIHAEIPCLQPLCKSLKLSFRNRIWKASFTDTHVNWCSYTRQALWLNWLFGSVTLKTNQLPRPQKRVNKLHFDMYWKNPQNNNFHKLGWETFFLASGSHRDYIDYKAKVAMQVILRALQPKFRASMTMSVCPLCNLSPGTMI